MIHVYILYRHRRMVLEEIEASSIMEADRRISFLLGEKIDKRNDIGCYLLHLFPKQREQDTLRNFCSH